jgi:hypothetical protein
LVAGVLVLLIGAGGGVAGAQERTKDEKARRAKALFLEGQTHFDLGQFSQAIEKFTAAYHEKPDPVIFYNIAQAHRLAGDPAKAIFFYKSYLRNAPDAPNRRDVEGKIAALQKQLDERSTAGAPPRPAETPAATPGMSPPPAAPSPGSTGSLPAAGPAPPESPGGMAGSPPARGPEPLVVTTAEGQPEAHPPSARRGDVGASAGISLWRVGLPSSTAPTAALAVGFGYVPAAFSGARLEGRLGGKLALTSLPDTSGRDLFLSALVEPTLRVRMIPGRLNLFAAVGLGLLVMTGVTADSVLLGPGAEMVTGALRALEVRPTLGAELHLTAALLVSVSSSLVYNTALDPYFRERSLVRIELTSGLGLRF